MASSVIVKEIPEEFFLHDGDTFSGSLIGFGLISSAGQDLWVYFPFGKSNLKLTNKTITCTRFICSLRIAQGGYVNGLSSDLLSYVQQVQFFNSDGIIGLLLKNTSGWKNGTTAITNNTPVSGDALVTFTFT